jgi:hypothetical protein
VDPSPQAQVSASGAFLATGYPFKAHAALDLYLEVFRDVFLRARAIRRCGAAALDLAYTAAGVYDGFFEFRLSPWDIAAGALLIAEAGGVVSDLDGGPGHLATGNVVAGNPAVQPELLAVLRRHGGERAVERLDPRRGRGAGAGAPAGVPETAEPVGAAAGEPRGGGGGMPRPGCGCGSAGRRRAPANRERRSRRPRAPPPAAAGVVTATASSSSSTRPTSASGCATCSSTAATSH